MNSPMGGALPRCEVCARWDIRVGTKSSSDRPPSDASLPASDKSHFSSYFLSLSISASTIGHAT